MICSSIGNCHADTIGISMQFGRNIQGIGDSADKSDDTIRIEKALNIIKNLRDISNEKGWGNSKTVLKKVDILIVQIFVGEYKPPTIGSYLFLALLMPIVFGAVIVKDIQDKAEEKRRNRIIEYPINPPIRPYRNHCWGCGHTITEKNVRCCTCHWFKCPSCGRCGCGFMW